MVRKQKGFTIIELVVVIVILGILSAVAFPKFSNMSDQANLAVAQGALAAVQSAAVIQFAANQGVKQSYASIQAQTTVSSGVTFSGNCGAPTASYGGQTTSAGADLSDYCSG